MREGLPEDLLALREVLERRFNPGQARDADGRWTDGLADRISLGAHERLVSSQRFRPSRGAFGDRGTQAEAAIVEGNNGRVVRLGITYPGGEDVDEQWNADPARSDTVSLNRRALRRLRNDLDDGRKAAKAAQADLDPDETHSDPLASGGAGGVTWSMYDEDDGLISASITIDPEADSLTLDPKQLVRFLKYLDELDGQMEGTVEVARFSPEQPRVEAGSSSGGQFAMADSGGKKKSNGSETLGYDPKSNRGTGYGTAGGDARVKRLQEALNRLGLTDQSGKPLKVDGKLGPKTTAAVKKLQRRLGLKADGHVTPALLDRIASMKDAKPAAKATPRPAPERTLTQKSATGRIVARGEPVVQLYDRTYPLDDIQIQRSGDGRTVEAYAAMFAAPYEVQDQHGHYLEVIDRAAFNRTLNGAGKNAMCLYNHGRNLEGQPDSMASIPLGTPLEIRPDGRGLLTVTRYNRGPYTDQVLEAIRNGDIKAQSFRGRIVRSDPNGRVPKPRYGQPLPTVTRHELGLADYGPTPIPVNNDAEIVAVRSVQDLLEELHELDADEREELLRSLNLELSTHDGDPDGEDEDDDPDEVVEPATPDDSGPGAEDPPAEEVARHSGRQQDIARRIRVAMLIRSQK